MRVLITQYHEVLTSGLSERTLARERLAAGAVRDALFDLAKEFVKGVRKPSRVIRACEYNPKTHEILTHREVGPDKKNPRRKRWEHYPRKPQLSDILAVRLRERNALHQVEDANGRTVKPCVRMVLADGTRMEFPYSGPLPGDPPAVAESEKDPDPNPDQNPDQKPGKPPSSKAAGGSGKG